MLPGITGLWQVSGRSELDFDDLVRLDFLYLERWSVFLDLDDPAQDDPRRALAPRRLLADRHRGAVLGDGDVLVHVLAQPLAQVGARLEAVVDRLEVDGDDARPRGWRATATTSSASIVIGSPAAKRAPPALTTTASGGARPAPPRTASQSTVSPAT